MLGSHPEPSSFAKHIKRCGNIVIYSERYDKSSEIFQLTTWQYGRMAYGSLKLSRVGESTEPGISLLRNL